MPGTHRVNNKGIGGPRDLCLGRAKDSDVLPFWFISIAGAVLDVAPHEQTITRIREFTAAKSLQEIAANIVQISEKLKSDLRSKSSPSSILGKLSSIRDYFITETLEHSARDIVLDILHRFFQILMTEVLLSDWFLQFVWLIFNLSKFCKKPVAGTSRADVNTCTYEFQIDTTEKETFDENDPELGDILKVFKDSHERQEWELFNSLYHKLLLDKAESIFVLRGIMRETLCHFVKRNIEQNVKSAYFGFCLKREKIVLVAIIDNVFFDQKEERTYRGVPILFKQWTETTEESVNTRKYEGCEDAPIFQEDVHTKIHECLMQNSPMLMKSHANIQIICASPYRSMDNGNIIKKENCILIYCSSKNVIPLGEMCYEESIGEFKTDVREGFFYRYPSSMDAFLSPTDRHPELKIGAEISREEGNVIGTLGGFVNIGDRDEIGFITCAHIIHDVPETMVDQNAKIVQPSYGLLEENNVCGFLITSHHPSGFDTTTVDASLVKVDSSRRPTRISFTGLRKDQIRQLGFSPNEIYSGEILESAAINAPCYKSGATTNFTTGKLEGRSLSAKYIKDFRDPYYELIFHDQYVVSSTSFSPFASCGDSGAFVFQCVENQGKKSYACIGMIVGGTSDLKVVVTPIREVLNALDLQDTEKLCTFEDEQMETDETDKIPCCIS